MSIVPISEAASNVEKGQSKDIFVPGGSQLYDQSLCIPSHLVGAKRWYYSGNDILQAESHVPPSLGLSSLS